MADTPKRITRAASRAASDRGTPAPVSASHRSPSAGGAGRAGNVDQGRSPAKRDIRELPPLPSKTSNAYGGAGREALAEGLQVHNQETDFAQVFDTRRVEAVLRSHDDRAARVERRSSQEPSPDPQEIFKRRISRVKLTVQPIREESDEFDKGQGNANEQLHGIFRDKNAAARTGNLQGWTQVEQRRQTKEQEVGGSYQPQAHANANSTTLLVDSMARENANSTTFLVDQAAHGYSGENRAAVGAGSQRRGGQNRHVPTPGTGFQPAPEVSWTSQPYFRKLWSILATILLLLGVVFLVKSRPDGISIPDKSNTIHPVESIKEYGDSTWTGVLRYASRWGNPNHANYPWDLAHTVKNLESQLQSLTSSTTLHDDSIKELQRILPDVVVLSRKTGGYEIPDDFWHALKDKLSDNPEAVGWETFLAKNEVQLRAFTDTELTSTLEATLKDKGIVSANMFTDMIRENHASHAAEIARLRSNLESRFSNVEATASESALLAAESAIRELLNQIPYTQLNTLAAANFVQNSNFALKSVNFFSASLGAVVDPYLSSSTQSKPQPKGVALYNRLFGTLGKPNPPISALEPWQEAGDCWCAAPPPKVHSRNGAEGKDVPKAQLAVRIPRLIYPTSITVEHVPGAATLDIAAAPKDMELWVRVDDTSMRDEITRHVAEYTYSKARESNRENGVALDESYVRIGRWRYDIHALNHVETFPLQINLKELGVYVNQAVVRATSNWGAEYTCLYRVRLHGIVKEEEEKE